MVGTTLTLLAWDYTAFDQNGSLNPQSEVFNTTTGSPVLVDTIALTPLGSYGVYYATYTGIVGDAYQTITPNYTDNTHGTVDTTRAPASESFQCCTFSQNPVTVVLAQATLVGQSTNAILVET
jgi:hypothetical protein